MFLKAIVFILLIAVVLGDDGCKDKNEEIYACEPGGNVCNFKGMVTLDCRINRCSCKPGYKYNKNHVCVPVGPDCK
ncbi:hypothetical protein TELCIR_02709 [Teladorsagia circumcincta]|uniref:TIL domain-containing protein n=1 Tax=Teladorsagia circumcincta TaxID=45464 RepID=A0A2G9UYF6_TELCI|nr:hypothetical protein TELCIR_02709 [Teladorsagia circumcincta]